MALTSFPREPRRSSRINLSSLNDLYLLGCEFAGPSLQLAAKTGEPRSRLRQLATNFAYFVSARNDDRGPGRSQAADTQPLNGHVGRSRGQSRSVQTPLGRTLGHGSGSGRTWDRNRPSPERLGATEGHFSGGLQGEAASAAEGSGRLETTGSNPAFGQQVDDERPRLADGPRSERGPSVTTSTQPVGPGDEPSG